MDNLEETIIPQKNFNIGVMIISFSLFYVLFFYSITYLYRPIVYGYLKIAPCNFNIHYYVISFITIILDLLVAYYLGSVLSSGLWTGIFTVLFIISFIFNLIFYFITRGLIGGVEGWNEGNGVSKCASYCPNIHDQGCYV